MEKERNDALKLAEDQKNQFLETQKTKVIDTIVSLEQKLHDISPKQVDDRKKFYATISKDTGIAGLELVEKTLTERSSKIVGATGMGETIIMESNNPQKRSPIAAHMEVNNL